MLRKFNLCRCSFFSSILPPQTIASIQLKTRQSLVPVHLKRSVRSSIQSKQFLGVIIYWNQSAFTTVSLNGYLKHVNAAHVIINYQRNGIYWRDKKRAIEISMNPCKDSAGEIFQQETLFSSVNIIWRSVVGVAASSFLAITGSPLANLRLSLTFFLLFLRRRTVLQNRIIWRTIFLMLSQALRLVWQFSPTSWRGEWRMKHQRTTKVLR